MAATNIRSSECRFHEKGLAPFLSDIYTALWFYYWCFEDST